MPCDDVALIPLTDLGHHQAQQVAEQWQQEPDLIITSPYLRTQQTAKPTIERFSHVPVEVWPIYEFTYLQPSRWNGTQTHERMPYIERYWEEADPHYCDGEGAESFQSLLDRAAAALDRLTQLQDISLVYVFTHGQFMQAIRSLVLFGHHSPQERMHHFWQKGRAPIIQNGERVPLEWNGGRWELAK